MSQAAVYGINSAVNSTFTCEGIHEKLFQWGHCDKDGRFIILFITPDSAFAFDSSDDTDLDNFTALSILYHSQDLNTTFATLANSMTNSIRQDSDNNLVVTDKVGTLHANIQVRWTFLIFSIVLVFANAVFLVMVIYYTHTAGLAVMCSDALPTVNLEKSVGPVLNKIRLRSGMEKAANFSMCNSCQVWRGKKAWWWWSCNIILWRWWPWNDKFREKFWD